MKQVLTDGKWIDGRPDNYMPPMPIADKCIKIISELVWQKQQVTFFSSKVGTEHKPAVSNASMSYVKKDGADCQ